MWRTETAQRAEPSRASTEEYLADLSPPRCQASRRKPKGQWTNNQLGAKPFCASQL